MQPPACFPGAEGYFSIICICFRTDSSCMATSRVFIKSSLMPSWAGIILFADTAYKELKYEKDQFYGLYGGLHISPFDDWDPKYDDLVIGLKKWNLQRVGCNHCTGLITAQKFVDAGYPVVTGTARFRSKTKNYLGNGDKLTFPA